MLPIIKVFSFLLFFISPLSLAESAESDVCNSQSDETGRLDQAFHYLNTKFCQPAIWFDSFFVDDRVEEDARAGTIVRWSNDFAWVEDEGYQYTAKFKARFHLPKVTKKLKVVFEPDDEDSLLDLFPSSSDDGENDFGLRYDWYAKGRSSFNIKASLRPSLEARYRYSYPFTTQTVARVTQKVYQKKKVTGESTHIDIDHSFSKKYLLRWANFATYEDDIKGWKVGSGFTFYHYISPKQALSYRTSLSGTNRPEHYIDNTHISVSYRHNYLRKWLYYEVTPAYNWNKEEELARESEASITFRVELLFHNI